LSQWDCVSSYIDVYRECSSAMAAKCDNELVTVCIIANEHG